MVRKMERRYSQVMNFLSPMKNKTVLITGASSGIGRALAVELAKRDWRVLAAGRNIESLNLLVERASGDRKNLKIELDKIYNLSLIHIS